MSRKVKNAAVSWKVTDGVPYEEIVASMERGEDLALTADNGSFRVFVADNPPVVVTEQTFLAALGAARRYWARAKTLPPPAPLSADPPEASHPGVPDGEE